MDRDIPQFVLFDVMFGQRTVDQHGDLLIFHQAESPSTATINLATFSDDMPEAPVDPWEPEVTVSPPSELDKKRGGKKKEK